MSCVLCSKPTSQNASQVQHSDTLTEVVAPPTGKVFLHDVTDLKTVHAFYADRKSDRNNVACGGIYRTQIARYKHRLRYGCLGSGCSFADNKSVTAERYFSQRHLSTDAAVTTLCPRKESVEHIRGFHVKPWSISSPAFIPLLTTGVSSNVSTCCQNSEGSSFTAEGRGTHSVSEKRSVQLNKQLADNPQDIDCWLELVRCQNAEVSGDSLSVGSTPDQLASAVADIQAAILDRALEKNPLSIALKLAQLEVCRGCWDVEKLAAEWKTVVFQHATDPRVWRTYLRYVRSSFRTFSTSRVTAAYIRAISTLHGARDGTLLSHKPPPRVTSHMIGTCCFCLQLLSLPRCASTQSQLIWASGICCCRPICLELTEL